MLPVFLDCPLVIVPSVFPNVYLFNYFMHYMSVLLRFTTYNYPFQGRIQDFKLGGGAHFKKLCRAEGGEKMFGVFRVKNHDFMPKNHIFSNFRGGGAHAGWCAPPPVSAPAFSIIKLTTYNIYINSFFKK
jgi:hypothetical protein